MYFSKELALAACNLKYMVLEDVKEVVPRVSHMVVPHGRVWQVPRSPPSAVGEHFSAAKAFPRSRIKEIKSHYSKVVVAMPASIDGARRLLGA